MKRKPTTKQTVKAELIRALRVDLIEAREGGDDYTITAARGRALGAIRLAYFADVIDDAEWRVLTALTHSTHERSIELIHGAPPYTGSARAKAWRDASKAVA